MTKKLPMPYLPDDSPWHDGKPTAVIRGFIERFTDLDLALPDQVADALTAFATATAWARAAAPNATAARQQYRRDLADAARNRAPEPDLNAVVAAVTRADAHAKISHDLAAVSQQLHNELVASVVANLDAVVAALASEHDRLMADAQDHASILPASVRTADAAVAAGPDAATAWAGLADTGQRLNKVRAARERIGVIHHPAGSSDYLLYRHPERFPDEPAPHHSPALAALELLTDPHAAGPWCPTRAQLAEHAERMTAAAAHTRRGPEARRGRYIAPPMWDTAS